MDIIQKIKSFESELTESERKVFRKFMEDPSIITMYTISQVAMMSETSTAAVLRFCQHIGFKGYKDFRYEILNWQKDHREDQPEADTVALISRSYSGAIASLEELDRNLITQLCEDIINSGKVIILGRYRTSTAAEKLRMNLTDLGITVITGTNTLDFQHLLYIINPDTTVIMFSTTGEVSDQKEFLTQLGTQTQRTWLITPAAGAKMSAYANNTIVIPAVRVGKTFAGSQTVMMAFSDIVTAVAETLAGNKA